MKQVRVQFENIPWQNLEHGRRLKELMSGKHLMRLVEFSSGFNEVNWCKKAHVGYVLEGSFTIDFNGTIVTYKQGDGIAILANNPHKLIIDSGDFASLILFEDLT